MCVQRGLTHHLSAMCPLHELLAGTQRASSHFGAGHVLPQPWPQSCPRRGGGELSIRGSLSDPISNQNMFQAKQYRSDGGAPVSQVCASSNV